MQIHIFPFDSYFTLPLIPLILSWGFVTKGSRCENLSPAFAIILFYIFNNEEGSSQLEAEPFIEILILYMKGNETKLCINALKLLIISSNYFQSLSAPWSICNCCSFIIGLA